MTKGQPQSTAGGQVIPPFPSLSLDSGPVGHPRRHAVGSVIVKEEADFRAQGRVGELAYNRVGIAILDQALRLCVEAKDVPRWLVLPAGLLHRSLAKSSAEEDAGVAVMTMLTDTIRARLREAAAEGLQGVLLGVDGCSEQVPVVIEAAHGSARGLARRADGDSEVPASHEGTRFLAGPPSLYVAYCGEIMATEDKGNVNGRQLGNGTRPDWTVDLAHYFRSETLGKVGEGDHRRHYSGVKNFVLKALGNRSDPLRLDSPVVASTFLILRDLNVQLNEGRPTFWFAVQRGGSTGRKESCLMPNRVLVGRADGQARMTVNLFG